jgi:NAD(P)-dependent dehydrogenase (short-subunit alcohol dehydrogenase family)
MEVLMADRVVLVTGANGGLGTFVTQAFLDRGDSVVGTSPRIQQEAFTGANFVAAKRRIQELLPLVPVYGLFAARKLLETDEFDDPARFLP